MVNVVSLILPSIIMVRHGVVRYVVIGIVVRAKKFEWQNRNINTIPKMVTVHRCRTCKISGRTFWKQKLYGNATARATIANYATTTTTTQRNARDSIDNTTSLKKKEWNKKTKWNENDRIGRARTSKEGFK